MRTLQSILIIGAFLAVITQSPARADSTTVQRFKTAGYAFAAFGDCPDTAEEPPLGTVCHDGSLTMAREAVAIDGGSLSAVNTPWSAFLYEATLTFGANGEAVASDERSGFIPALDDVAVTYDREHLAFASLHADFLMSDGSTSSVSAVWQPISDRMVFGNDGPALVDFGVIRHAVDRCSTQVNQSHQKFRIAAMSGTVGGAPVHTYTAFPAGYIAFNHFVFIDASHGVVCG